MPKFIKTFFLISSPFRSRKFFDFLLPGFVVSYLQIEATVDSKHVELQGFF